MTLPMHNSRMAPTVQEQEMGGRTERGWRRIVWTAAWAVCLLCTLVHCGPNMGSIGAMLGKHHTTGKVTVREVPIDMEAARAGLQPGDEILLIEGRDVRRMSAEEVHEALVGPIGTKVALTVERDGEILRLEVRRGPLKD